VAHRLLAAGHAVGQHVVGVVVEAMLARLGIAQHQDALDQRPVVGLAGHLAAPAPGPPGLLAQVAAVGIGQEGFDQRAVQGDDMRRLVQAALGRRLPGRRPHEIRQAGQIVLAAQHQLVGGLVGQHVLGELGAQRGQLLHDGRIALGLRPQAGTGAHAVQVQALQQAQGLGLQAQAVALGVQGVQAGEHPGVHLHRAVVRRQRRGQFALHGLQRRRGGRGGQVGQQRIQAVEPGAGAVQGRHGVLEAGGLGLAPMASSSSRCSAMAACIAGTKCSGWISSKAAARRAWTRGTARDCSWCASESLLVESVSWRNDDTMMPPCRWQALAALV
jgi:hypothetical protein